MPRGVPFLQSVDVSGNLSQNQPGAKDEEPVSGDGPLPREALAGRACASHHPLRERLPAIRIPLRPTDPDVPLDLQALIDRCYENGRYDDLDYTREPDPPLDPPDAEWAEALLRGKGLRPAGPQQPG